MASSIGIAPVLNSARLGREEILEALSELTGDSCVDTVFECAGEPQAFAEALHFVRKGGIVVEMGHFIPNGEVAIGPDTICRKEVVVMGSILAPVQVYPTAIHIAIDYHSYLEAIVTNYYTLEQFREAFDHALERRGLKVVFTPNK